MGPYLKRIRKMIGHQKIIYPGARIIIENAQKEILFIRRKDNGMLGLPAGGLEENESISECIRREVKEETGLELLSLEIIGIISNPNCEHVRYSNGDEVQYFAIEFYSNIWKGKLNINDPAEVIDVHFLHQFNIYNLPQNEYSTWRSLNHFRRTGNIKVS
jgi:ADP-ribose pyrophosphatase YjhB (NUDIX family)